MLTCFPKITLEQLSNTIGIATPIILLFWFYYSQKQNFSKIYYDQIDGIYAAFTDPIYMKKDTPSLHSGIIMHIRDTDGKGYFKGQLDYGETTTNGVTQTKNHDGIYDFFGKINFEIYKNKTRHPFKPDENRIYKGTLFIVDGLDFDFENNNIKNYVSAEYEILHYREMEALKFTLKRIHNSDKPKLPLTFTLRKKFGFEFEPYKSVKQTVFSNQTRVDK